MALIKCFDCGKQVSSEAQACPACACPVSKKHQEKCDIEDRNMKEVEKKKSNLKTWGKIYGIIFIYFLLMNIFDLTSYPDWFKKPPLPKLIEEHKGFSTVIIFWIMVSYFVEAGEVRTINHNSQNSQRFGMIVIVSLLFIPYWYFGWIPYLGFFVLVSLCALYDKIRG